MNQPDLFDVGFSVGPGKRRLIAEEKGKAVYGHGPEDCKRVLGKCQVKGCQYCKAIDLPTRQTSHYSGGQTFTTKVPAWTGREQEMRCPTHPRTALKWSIIEGTLSDVHKCDPRCTSARGPVCVCSCAGANHGADYL